MARKPLSPEARERARMQALKNLAAMRAKRENTIPAVLAGKEEEPIMAAVLPPGGEYATQPLEIEVQDPGPAPAPSLKDRLFGGRGGFTTPSAPIKKAPAGGRKKQDNLISTVLPTVIASFIATYSRQILPDEYKRCAPSQEEANGVLGPLLAIVGRRVEIAGKASQDVIDFTNSLIVGFAYTARAYITYADIKREQGRNYQNANSGNSGDSTNGYAGGERAINYSSGISDNNQSNTSDGDSEATIVANLLERDKQGRIKLGLLAG